jgi:hypothetical protein
MFEWSISCCDMSCIPAAVPIGFPIIDSTMSVLEIEVFCPTWIAAEVPVVIRGMNKVSLRISPGSVFSGRICGSTDAFLTAAANWSARNAGGAKFPPAVSVGRQQLRKELPVEVAGMARQVLPRIRAVSALFSCHVGPPSVVWAMFGPRIRPFWLCG